jgi:hypothetical protein
MGLLEGVRSLFKKERVEKPKEGSPTIRKPIKPFTRITKPEQESRGELWKDQLVAAAKRHDELTKLAEEGKNPSKFQGEDPELIAEFHPDERITYRRK